jgi:ketosteroid isomerase-like protein
MLALPGPGLSFSAARVEVARSGDLAWEEGTYEFATSDEKGKTTTEKATYVTVWQKTAGRRLELGRRYPQYERMKQKNFPMQIWLRDR